MKIFITGTGIYSALGNSSSEVFNSLTSGKSGIRYMNDWPKLNNLNCYLGSPTADFDSKVLPRTSRRSMSKMSEMGTLATLDALKQADIDLSLIDEKKIVFIYGSTTGSQSVANEFFSYLNRDEIYTYGNSFLKIMNHTTAANISSAINFNGPIISPSSACATSSQAIALGWELLKSGLYDIAICGGADELDYSTALVFDNLHAAVNSTNSKISNPRPFDKNRSGLVVSEGASTVILESENSPSLKNKKSLVEVASACYYRSGNHLTQNSSESIEETIRWCLQRAQLNPNDIDYINAHATGTLQGDQQEATATKNVFNGLSTPISSLKGHFGHSLAACGAIEVICCIEMIKNSILIPTLNLEEVATDCEGLNYIKNNVQTKTKHILTNNFGFGGINTSIILKEAGSYNV